MPDGPGGFAQDYSCPALLRIPLSLLSLRVPDYHRLWSDFPEHSTHDQSTTARSYNPSDALLHLRFGLFPGRSPLLGESLVYFLFLEVLRCFSSLGLPLYISQRYTFFKCMGCPIRKSSDQRLFAPTRSLSQLITSFIASVSLGIRHTPFLTFFFTGSSLLLNCFSSKMNGSSYFQLYCFLNYC